MYQVPHLGGEGVGGLSGLWNYEVSHHVKAVAIWMYADGAAIFCLCSKVSMIIQAFDAYFSSVAAFQPYHWVTETATDSSSSCI